MVKVLFFSLDLYQKANNTIQNKLHFLYVHDNVSHSKARHHCTLASMEVELHQVLISVSHEKENCQCLFQFENWMKFVKVHC